MNMKTKLCKTAKNIFAKYVGYSIFQHLPIPFLLCLSSMYTSGLWTRERTDTNTWYSDWMLSESVTSTSGEQASHDHRNFYWYCQKGWKIPERDSGHEFTGHINVTQVNVFNKYNFNLCPHLTSCHAMYPDTLRPFNLEVTRGFQPMPYQIVLCCLCIFFVIGSLCIMKNNYLISENTLLMPSKFGSIFCCGQLYSLMETFK